MKQGFAIAGALVVIILLAEVSPRAAAALAVIVALLLFTNFKGELQNASIS